MSNQELMLSRNNGGARIDVSNSLQERMIYAEQFAQAGLFSDVKGMSQCLVKIQAGAELGFPPYYSMNGISIIQGKPSVGAGMFNALIEASPQHELEILESTDTKATGRFYSISKRTKQWVCKGDFTYSMQDATRMGLAGKDNYKKQPRAMLLHRMISGGARLYFPSLCAGLYLPEELNPDIKLDATGEALDIQSFPVTRDTAEATSNTASTYTATEPTEEERLKQKRADLVKAFRAAPVELAPSPAMIAKVLHIEAAAADSLFNAKGQLLRGNLTEDQVDRLTHYAATNGDILPAAPAQDEEEDEDPDTVDSMFSDEETPDTSTPSAQTIGAMQR
jgi:hypothetical protein